jgi:hypothetical protein
VKARAVSLGSRATRIVFWAAEECSLIDLVDSLCNVETIHTDLCGTTFKKQQHTFHEKQLFFKVTVHDLY